MSETFGQRFYRLRRKKDMTQEEVAKRVNVTAQAVSKWENDASLPDVGILVDLSDVLDVSVDELLGKEQTTAVILSKENRKDADKLIMKVRVISSDGDRVSVNLPISLIKAVLNSGMKLPMINGNPVLESIDFKQIIELAEQGVVGQIAEITSSDGDQVKVIIE